MSVIISGVNEKSVCFKKKIRPGDKLLTINGNEINDVLDYRFYCDEEKLRIEFLTASGKHKTVKLKNLDSPDEIGLDFETYLMDKQKSCKNKCIFCFIDQLPKGLRRSLYFKDDDARLSFLFGNYITLTNLSENDVQRIIKMHISPINASVHTMDPELRVKMMKNPAAGESLKYLYRFSEAGIKINVQLVLCPGINDGENLAYSLRKLKELKNLQSIAAVPVGLTKYRDGLCPLRGFSPDEAAAVIDTIDLFNSELIAEGRDRLAYPSDEFFQLCSREMPPYEYYGDFPQLENGVGMCTSMRYEFLQALEDYPSDDRKRSFAVVTGMAAYELQKELAGKFKDKFPNSDIEVYGIKNEFFGEKITVAGLLTGRDIINFLKKEKLHYDTLLFPSAMFKSREELIFLDDISLSELENALGVKAVVTDCDAYSLVELFYSLERR
ncbi:MAG: DUF512 domain-containing protein [Oscillospiraceae bacterium]|nr:DUF512 domain-containing protein [Oscillospiraceae bacterium]